MPLKLKRYVIPVFLLAVVILPATPSLSQIIETRQFHGKEISCGLSGLRGFDMPCGLDGNYVFIFTGQVLSVTEESNDEKHLQLRPQEIFLGAPPGELTVTTNQGDCLGDFQPGDHWLFYLERNHAHQLVLAYGSPSAPVAEAEVALAELRRLMGMTNLGIVRGHISQEIRNDVVESRIVAKHKVVARRESNGAE